MRSSAGSLGLVARRLLLAGCGTQGRSPETHRRPRRRRRHRRSRDRPLRHHFRRDRSTIRRSGCADRAWRTTRARAGWTPPSSTPTGPAPREPFEPAVDPPVDCFYVYPTVSEATSDNAPLEVTDAEVRTVRAQAARFAASCRLFAPIYRQITRRGLVSGALGKPAARERAYDDVLSAFNDYLNTENRGRPFVLIGHSQGATVLTVPDPAGDRRQPAAAQPVALGPAARWAGDGRARLGCRRHVRQHPRLPLGGADRVRRRVRHVRRDPTHERHLRALDTAPPGPVRQPGGAARAWRAARALLPDHRTSWTPSGAAGDGPEPGFTARPEA